MSHSSDPDPFGTEALRRRVLDAWAASPDRFREDANTEEDLALGGYRDRVVVELAQNAADAARRAGVPGRLRLTLRDRTLVAANTGAPLDAAGVAAAATLRASAKRDEPAAVGRFGVGFAAVVAVTGEPRIRSSAGSVRWSGTDTRDLAAGVETLRGELERRRGHVPVLRLPFPAHGPDDVPPPGFDTAVVLPLRDEDAERLVRRLLHETGDPLLIALPALRTVEVEVDGAVRVLRAERRDVDPGGGQDRDRDGDIVVDADGAATRWRTAQAAGRLDPALLADRPTEERERPYWSVRWAVPVDEAGAPRPLPAGVPRAVHAPTPSDERLGLPALLIASFPLAPDRRHVAPGPLTDELVEHAAATYAELVRDLAPVPDLLTLVPSPAAEGELDAKLRRAVNRRLPETPFLPTAEDDAHLRQRPRDAVAVQGGPALTRVLAPVLPGLLPPDWPVRSAALTALGVRRLDLAEVVDLLAELDREPSWWRELYGAVADADAEQLGALPVPLADGRLVRGPRGLLLATEGVDPELLAPLGLRIVHPDAAHPLLRRLGAAEAGPRAVLDNPQTRAAVAASYDMAGGPDGQGGGTDADDPASVAEAVLTLVAALVAGAGIEPGEEPWLGDLALPAADGDVYSAAELLLPGSPLAEVMLGETAGDVAEDAPFGTVAPELIERFGADVLEAVGVLRTFALLREQDVALDPAAVQDHLDEELDGGAEWAADTLARLPGGSSRGPVPPMLPEIVAVRDLELVAGDRWDRALALLAEPPLREALVEPALVVLPNGRRVEVPSYTAWWLRRHPVLGGRRPTELRAPDADPALWPLYDEAPAGPDPEVLGALAVRTSLDTLLAEPGGPDELLARLVERDVDRAVLHGLLTAVAEVEPDRVTPPERLRALVRGEAAGGGSGPEGWRTTVVLADDAVVVDAPDLLPLVADRPLLLQPYDRAEALAEVLDVAMASEEVTGEVGSAGTRRPVPEVAARVLPGCPTSYRAHAPLIVDGQEVAWRYVDGVVHAGDLAGLARGLAWASGRWGARLIVEAALRDPDRLDDLLAEADLDASAR